MKRGSTFFLRGVVFLIGIAVLALYIFALPRFANIAAEMLPALAYLRYPAVIGWYATSIPFFFALYQTLRLLSYIDKNKAFSDLSVKALKNIKYCAVSIGILLMAGLPTVYFIADIDDAPGLMLIGLVIAFVPIVISTFAAVLQRLLKEAIDIKSENDSTI